MKKLYQNGTHTIWVVVVLALLIVGGSGYFIYQRNNKTKEDSPSSQNTNPQTEDSVSKTDDSAPFGIDYTVYKANENQNPGFEENESNTKTVREIVAFARLQNCITDKLTGKVIGEQTEAQFISKLVLDDAQKRALLVACNHSFFIGRTKTGDWEQIFDMGQTSKVSTVVSEACGLSNILNKLVPFAVKGDTLNKLILDDGYYGGLGTTNYTEATGAAVKACKDFVAING